MSEGFDDSSCQKVKTKHIDHENKLISYYSNSSNV